MNASPRRACLSPWTFLGLIFPLGAILSFFSLAGAAQDPVAALVLPSQPVEAGTTIPVWLLFANTTEHDLEVAFPARLQGTLQIGPAEQGASLDLANPGEAGTASIRPGEFARREYRLVIPTRLEGPVVLNVKSAGVNPVAMEVRRPTRLAGPPSPILDVTGAGTEFDPVEFFKDHISGYEPFYFIAGTEPPNAKFQISFKYQILSNQGYLARRWPGLKGLHLAYTQTSLWDWSAPSAPFEDSSYRPEFFYRIDGLQGGWLPGWVQLGVQTGLQHESNGRGGTESRSLNIAYVQPTATLGRKGSFRVSLAPRVFTYVGDLSDNPDLKDFRGHVELRSVVGWERGLELLAVGRVGDDWDRGSVQLDLSYPMAQFLLGDFSVYFHLQYFYGYGETLLQYNERGSSIRAGVSIYR